MNARPIALLVLVVAGLSLTARARAEHPLDPIIKLANEHLDYVRKNVRDYTAVVIKRERRDDGKLPEAEHMFVKIRNRNEATSTPFSVYIKYLRPRARAGREVIWVEGRNNGQLVAHESGFLNLVRVNLDPKSSLAMAGNRYPITDLGIENLCSKLATRSQEGRKFGDCKVDIHNDAKVGDRNCKLIKVVFPKPQDGLKHYMSQVFIDQQLNVPIRYAAFKWPENSDDEPPVDEEYTYTELKLNVGLTDKDFDPNNREYRFP